MAGFAPPVSVKVASLVGANTAPPWVRATLAASIVELSANEIVPVKPSPLPATATKSPVPRLTFCKVMPPAAVRFKSPVLVSIALFKVMLPFAVRLKFPSVVIPPGAVSIKE